MRRRTLLAATAAAAPAAAVAQPGDRVRRVAVVMVNDVDDAEGQARLAAFRQRLSDLGWQDGRNLRIDTRWNAGEPERARAHAAELAVLAPDVIVANGSPAATALQRGVRDIPIVLVVVADPLGAGFVPSLARPGGNITGFSTFEPEIAGKWLELLREMSPGLRRVAGILDPAFPAFARLWDAVDSAARRLDIAPTAVLLREPGDDVESALAAFAREPDGGLIVLPTAINNAERRRIIALAARHRLPAIYPFRFYAASGGLMSYGFETRDLFRRGAVYVDRILKGERPGELPVQAPTAFELIIHRGAAASIGLAIPPSLLARADEVIE